MCEVGLLKIGHLQIMQQGTDTSVQTIVVDLHLLPT